LLRSYRAACCSPLKYTEYIDGCGMALFERVCELDLEGIVAKQDGREELFERERHSEPVAGWHVCALACAELEHVNR